MPYLDLKSQLATALAKEIAHPQISAQLLSAEFSTPPKVEMGHLALPCFQLAKHLRKSANQIATQLIQIPLPPGVAATAAGPYVNFKFDSNRLYQATVTKILSQRDKYGYDQVGNNKQVVLEYCSPNIAKQLAFHHIRSTLIGNTLANVYGVLGYETQRINYIGDWGAQFARLLAAVDLWGDKQALSTSQVEASMGQLFDLYVRFHQESDKDESLLDKANQWLQSLEQGDEKAVKVWETVRDISVLSLEQTLKRLQVHFDHVEGESRYIPDMLTTLETIKSQAGAKESEGAWIVEVDGIDTPALIQKRDGTTLYVTRDIAAAIDRFNRFAFEKMIYVVGEQQSLHFRLFLGVLKKMGHQWTDRCEHVSFGTVLFGTERMSTREGRVVFLAELLDKAKELALAECTEKNPDLKNKDEVAEMIGVGAVIFGQLSNHRKRDINFDWKNVLALDGDTGPYVQYALVRCRSLLKKAQDKQLLPQGPGQPASYPFSIDEETLLLVLARYRGTLHQVVAENDPFYLTRYLIELARSFSRFYYQLPVLQASDAHQREIRLNFVRATAQVLSNGLTLLGISCPQEM